MTRDRTSGVITPDPVLGTPLSIRACTSLADVAHLRREIDQLNEASSRPCPFSTFAFFSAHVEYDDLRFDGVQASVLLLLASRDERLVGFLPLRRRRRFAFGRAFTRVEWLATRDNERPHLVARPEDEASCADAFVRWLHADRTWSAMVLSGHDERSPLHAAMRAMPRRSCMVTERLDRPTAVIPIRVPTLDAYYRSLDQKMRSNTARLARKLFAAGDVGYVTSDDPLALEALLDVYLDVEDRSWKARSNAAVGQRPRRVAYLRECLTGRTGVRPAMGVVTLSGAPIAAIIQGTFGNNVYALKMAYDNAWSAVAPGRFLLLLSVAEAIQARYREYNLMSGFDYFKARLGADVVENTSLQVLRIGRLPFHHGISTKIRRLGGRRRGSEQRLDHNPAKRHAAAAAGGPRSAAAHLEAEGRRLREITSGPGRVKCETHLELIGRLPFPIG